MINLKTKHEIELMAAAGRLLSSVVDEMKAACEPGVTTGELDRLADRQIRKGGGRPGFLGYQDYPKSTCISVNDEVVHGIPGKRVIKEGDIVSLDLGLVLDGFWADMGCTVPVGRVSPEALHLIRVTEESFWAGMKTGWATSAPPSSDTSRPPATPSSASSWGTASAGTCTRTPRCPTSGRPAPVPSCARV
jgi:methionyl aminopeptidase